MAKIIDAMPPEKNSRAPDAQYFAEPQKEADEVDAIIREADRVAKSTRRRRPKRSVQQDYARLKIQAVELYRDTDMTQVEIARRLGVGQGTVSTWTLGLKKNRRFRRQVGAERDDYGPRKNLSEEAKRGLEDFAYFRNRYCERELPAFQAEVIAKVDEGMARAEDPIHRFLFLWPPTFGKTLLSSIDYVLWRICKDRSIRILILSKTLDLVTDIMREIRWHLEFNELLIEDYGEFKDETLWRQTQLLVLGREKARKDPTISATSANKHIVGRRCDLLIVDDLCDGSNSSKPEDREKLSRWFHKEALSRVEPKTGVAVVVGTRFSPHDLYSELIGLKLEGVPIWQLTQFQVHNAVKCDGETHKAYPEGCHLWPERFPYKELLQVREGMTPAEFDFVYQQMDVPTDDVLAKKIYIEGGYDEHTGFTHPGCLDHDRSLWELPDEYSGKLYVGIDPSAENYAAFTLWYRGLETGSWYLIAIERKRMQAPEYTIIMNDWWTKSQELLGRYIDEYVIETVGAFRFLLQDPRNRDWRQQTGARVFPFETTIHNKYDEKYGVSHLGPEFAHGRVRIPHKTGQDKLKVAIFIDEATKYPHGATSDTIMSFWFPWVRANRMHGSGRAVATTDNKIPFKPDVGDYWKTRSGTVKLR